MLTCPNCPHTVGDASPPAYCPSCGNAWAARQSPTYDLLMIANRQRVLLLCILLSIVSYCVVGWPAIGRRTSNSATVTLIITLAIHALVIVAVLRVQAAVGIHLLWRLLSVPLLPIPIIGLLIMVVVNSQASATLRASGVRVGLFGVDPVQLQRLSAPNLCQQCGYDLTGNLSGRCPECGTATRGNPIS